MGLDIYFKHTKVQFDGDSSNTEDRKKFIDEADKVAQEELEQKIKKLIAPLREAWEHLQTNDYWRKTYNERYFTFVEKIRPLIAKNYDWKIHPYTNAVLDFPDLEEKLQKEIEMSYLDYDVYFRKVNFLFAYYQNQGKMVDECFALTDADDIDDIISRCERVLKDHELADTLLPAQSGFFFGSTDYDEYYFSDVKDCLRQMKKYRKLLTDEVTAFVYFSW
jgi:hypothetical protein